LKGQELRRKLILDIIKNEGIHNQCELKQRLQEAGIEVTQATLSRDLRALGVGRGFDAVKGYIYKSSSDPLPAAYDSVPETPEEVLKEIKDIQFSGNLAVIKTKLGHATGVAFEIDQLKIPDVLGTIGGDDTLLVILKEDADRDSFLKLL
jgi:transcriptional regulator of arginine metabolism